MEIRTFTTFWNMERKLYSIYDINLPMPISLKVVGAFLLAGIPWWGLMVTLHVPLGDLWGLWIFPPMILGYAASKPWFQKKTLVEFLLSQINYWRQPKRLAGFKAIDYQFDKKHRFIIKVFKQISKDN